MEILFVSHKYPPATGGMEKQSFELINGMRQHAKVHTIIYDNKASRISFFATLNKRILKLCKANPGIGIIHLNDGLLASFCSYHTGYDHLKKVVTLHGLDVVFPSKIFQRTILPRFNKFNLIIAVSAATARACIQLGISANKVVVINNGVDPDIVDYTPTTTLQQVLTPYNIHVDDKKVLVAMGRAVQRKGFSWFIDKVVPQLQGEYYLLLIGPFSDKPSFAERLFYQLPAGIRRKLALLLGYPTDQRPLRKLLAEPRYKNRVKHLGKLPFDALMAVLKSADTFIMPNIAVQGDMEGFGLVCLEACLSGALVFASDIDGIPDAIRHNKNGILIESGNVHAWANELNSLLADTHKAVAQQAAFQQYTLQNFSWQKMVLAYWQQFELLQK